MGQLSIAFADVDADEMVGKVSEDLAERLQVANPTSEAAHRAIMRVHAGRGDENLALRQLETCRALLKRHLDVEPEAQTIALAESLLSARPIPKHAAAPLRLEEEKTRSNSSGERRFDQPAIAIMPFDNLGAPEDDYFTDGVVGEITSALSRVRDFFVIARQSAFTYKERFVDVRDVGKELGVNYVVEGTVGRGGDRLRISVQLVDAETRDPALVGTL